MTVYVLYRGDEVLGVGTAEELAARYNLKPETIRFYASNAQKSRNKPMVAERFTVKPNEFVTMHR